jgi:endonuclease/exonuclease/phosphatase family metal-dependent hydrolase
MKIRVVTYNIHRAIGVDRRFRLERVEEILRHHNGDIVLLQEVDKGAPRSRELDLAAELRRRLDYPYCAAGHNVRLRKGVYGNATLSRFPILRERNIDLTVGSRKRRGCQHTTLRAESAQHKTHVIEIFNLHLGLSQREREKQVGLLAHSHEFRDFPRQTASIIGGDFNDWRARLRPIFTEILGFSSASERRSHSIHDIRTYPSFSPSGALDKLFYRGSIRRLSCHRCRMRLSKVTSDHLPLIADFELV